MLALAILFSVVILGGGLVGWVVIVRYKRALHLSELRLLGWKEAYECLDHQYTKLDLAYDRLEEEHCRDEEVSRLKDQRDTHVELCQMINIELDYAYRQIEWFREEMEELRILLEKTQTGREPVEITDDMPF